MRPLEGPKVLRAQRNQTYYSNTLCSTRFLQYKPYGMAIFLYCRGIGQSNLHWTIYGPNMPCPPLSLPPPSPQTPRCCRAPLLCTQVQHPQFPRYCRRRIVGWGWMDEWVDGLTDWCKWRVSGSGRRVKLVLHPSPLPLRGEIVYGNLHLLKSYENATSCSVANLVLWGQ